MQKIYPNAVYTTEEVRSFLKISKSTIKRFLKNGIIRANKIGGRYRILGKEILRLVSPQIEEKTARKYHEIKSKTKERIKEW